MVRKIEVDKIGPISHLNIGLPEGGIVVLQGRNGTGKSETIEAVNKLLGQDADIATPTDGFDRGYVEGLGARLGVGRTTRRTGQLEVITIDSRFSVADLVNPPIKNLEAADEHRTKAILGILQVRPDIHDWLPIAEKDPDIEKQIHEVFTGAPNVLVMAARLKKHFGDLAKSVEEKAKEEQTAVRLLIEADPRVSADREPVMPANLAELSEKLTAATKAYGKLEDRLAKSQQQAPLVEELESLERESCDVDAVNAEAARLVKALDDAYLEYERLRNEATQAQAAAERTRLIAERVAKLRSTIDRTTAPTEKELQEARLAAQNAELDLIESEKTKKLIADRAIARERSHTARIYDRTAELLRQSSKMPEAILTRLAQSRVEGLIFEGGRLMVDHPKRGRIAFAELSTGERWKFAMMVAICGVGEGGLLTIPQDAWQDLDPTNRKLIAQIAVENKVVVLTAECTDDPKLCYTVYPSTVA